MVGTEKAITHKCEDRLDRDGFAETLAKNIINYRNGDSLTVGITGAWGSGKSSLINLTVNKLQEYDEVIIIKFNPWFFSNQNNLYYQFFKLLITTLKEKEINDKGIFEIKTKPQRVIFKKFGVESLKDYFNFIEHSSIEFTDNVFHSINYQDLESYESLDSLKKKCDDYFEGLDCKIIVVIDDIDRLLNDEIKQIFTLVKSLADFKKFIYILSFDKNVVAKALGEYHSEYKYKFLEKIVQIPIIVPEIPSSKINEFILEDIKPIYDNCFQETYVNRDDNFEQISILIIYFIRNIRDLKRYVNVVEFYLTEFLPDLNMDDYFLLIALQLFEYEVYLLLKDNKKILTTKLNIDENDENNRLNDFYKKIDQYREKLSFNELMHVLVHLFPMLKYQTKDSYSKSYFDELHKKHKIGSKDHFDKYFSLSLENNEVSVKTVNNLIKPNISVEEINKIVSPINDRKYNLHLFDELLLIVDEIPKENCEPIIFALLKNADRLNLSKYSRVELNKFLDNLFKKLKSPDKSYQIFKNNIDYENNFFTSIDYIHHLSVKKNKTGIPLEDLIFTKNDLGELEDIVVSQIKRCLDDGKLFYQNYLSTILDYWKYYDNISVIKRCVLKKTQDDYFLIEFLKKHNLYNVEFYVDAEDISSYVALDFDALRDRYFETLMQDYFENLIELNLRVIKICKDINTSQNHKEFCKKFVRQFEEFKKTSYHFQKK